MTKNIGIGIRCTPKEVFFSISEIENDEISLILVDSIVVPYALETPEKLKYVRSTILDILGGYLVNRACIRTPESVAQSANVERTNLEAIMQEVIASSSVEKYYIGQISNISSKLNIARDEFKKYIAGKMNFDLIEGWGNFNENEKESILSSISSLKL